MNDWTFVSSESSNVRVNMQRIRVSIQSVQQSLIDKGLILKNHIRVALGGWGKD